MVEMHTLHSCTHTCTLTFLWRDFSTAHYIHQLCAVWPFTCIDWWPEARVLSLWFNHHSHWHWWHQIQRWTFWSTTTGWSWHWLCQVIFQLARYSLAFLLYIEFFVCLDLFCFDNLCGIPFKTALVFFQILGGLCWIPIWNGFCFCLTFSFSCLTVLASIWNSFCFCFILFEFVFSLPFKAKTWLNVY